MIASPRRQTGASRAGCLITAAVVVLFVVAAGYALLNVGMGMVEEQVKQDILDNPVILEHVGNIETIEIDYEASAALPGDDVFVFLLAGSKGTAEMTATVKTLDEDTEKVVAGSLRLPSGQTMDLFPQEDAPAEAAD